MLSGATVGEFVRNGSRKNVSPNTHFHVSGTSQCDVTETEQMTYMVRMYTSII